MASEWRRSRKAEFGETAYHGAVFFCECKAKVETTPWAREIRCYACGREYRIDRVIYVKKGEGGDAK